MKKNTAEGPPLRLPDQAARTQPYRLATGRYLHQVAFDFGEPSPGTPRSTRFDELMKRGDFMRAEIEPKAQARRSRQAS